MSDDENVLYVKKQEKVHYERMLYLGSKMAARETTIRDSVIFVMVGGGSSTSRK